MFKHRRLIMLSTVAVLAAVVFFSTIADYLPCGDALHRAVGWVGLADNPIGGGQIWGRLVCRCRCDVLLVGWISAVFGVANAVLVAYIGRCFFRERTAHADVNREESRTCWISEGAGALLGVAFVVTPEFWGAATRLSGMMVELVFPLSALAILARLMSGRSHRRRAMALFAAGALSAGGCWEGPVALVFVLPSFGLLWKVAGMRSRGFRRVARPWTLGLVVAFFGIPGLAYRSSAIATEAMARLVRSVPCELLHSGLVTFFLIGVLPFVVLSHLVRHRRFVDPRWSIGLLGVWLAAVGMVACYTATSGVLSLGRTTAAFADDVLGELNGRAWLVSEGPLDDLFLLKKPSDVRLVTLARNREAAYGRILAEWAKEELGANDDLLFAAELGPQSFLDEWRKADGEFSRKVLCPVEYFGTSEKWKSVWEKHKDGLSVKSEPHQRYLHRLMGKIGVGFGCRLLAEGKKEEGWRLFYRVANEVDRDNLSALVNLCEVMNNGLQMPSSLKNGLETRLRTAQKKYSLERTKRVLAASGRVYVDDEMRRRYDELLKTAKPGPKAVRLVNAMKRAGKSASATQKARDELRKAVDDGAAEIGSVSRILVSLDMALGDKTSAENDALDALRHNRQDGAANALMGALRGEAGDYASAERFLRRAVRGGNVPPTAYNDLAETLIHEGKAEEAVAFAQKAVAADPANWCFSETLASACLEARQLSAAEKALATAVRCAAEAKVQTEARNTLDLTQARLWKVQGKMAELRTLVQSLKRRENLRPDQQCVLNWLEKGI